MEERRKRPLAEKGGILKRSLLCRKETDLNDMSRGKIKSTNGVQLSGKGPLKLGPSGEKGGKGGEIGHANPEERESTSPSEQRGEG